MYQNDIQTAVENLSEALIRISENAALDPRKYSEELLKKIRVRRYLIMGYIGFCIGVEHFFPEVISLSDKATFIILFCGYSALAYFLYYTIHCFSEAFHIDDEEVFASGMLSKKIMGIITLSVVLILLLYSVGVALQFNIILTTIIALGVNDLLVQAVISIYLDRVSTQVHTVELRKIEEKIEYVQSFEDDFFNS